MALEKTNQFVVVQAKLPVGLVAALDDFIKTQQPRSH